MMYKYPLLLLVILFFFNSCKEEKYLPIYGKEAIKTEAGYDTIINKIEPFEFVDQKGELVNNESFKNKIFVTDFFFTACPSICPVMTKQMLRINDTFIANDAIKLLSHTIDPDRDSIQKLNAYALKVGIETNDKWHFVTGAKKDLSQMAENYMIVAYADEDVPGGFEHSGYFILVDKQQQVRGYYDGTLEEDVTELIQDIQILLNED